MSNTSTDLYDDFFFLKLLATKKKYKYVYFSIFEALFYDGSQAINKINLLHLKNVILNVFLSASVNLHFIM